MQNFIPDILGTLDRAPNAMALRDAQTEAGDGVEGLRTVLARLGVGSAWRSGATRQGGSGETLALAVTAQGEMRLVRRREELLAIAGDAPYLSFFKSEEKPPARFSDLTRRLEPTGWRVLILSLVIGVLALAPVFFNRVVYDHIIAAGSLHRLPFMVAGVLLALVAEAAFRIWRSHMLGNAGARVDHLLGVSIFQRLLRLSPVYTEPASVAAQVNRLRDFENIRDFVTGPLAILLFEMPLVAVYTVVMGCMAGSLVFVPVVVVAAYAVLIVAMGRTLKRGGQRTASAGARRQQYIVDTVGKLETLRAAGLEDVWRRRYRALSHDAAVAGFRAAYIAQVTETLSYVLMTAGGVATIAFGVDGVIDHRLTSGALMAAMMLIWRILAPLQVVCASITRLQQVRASAGQVDRLLALPPEGDETAATVHPGGEVGFHRVSLRYTAEAEPALLGVNFTIPAGHIVAIRGANGSGKSSILRLVLGLNQPQSGSIRLGGVDLRQFDPAALRQAIAYVPQDALFLPGTVRDNLLFGAPDANDTHIRDALRDACAIEAVDALPHGLDTIIEGDGAVPLPFLLRQRLNLARAYVRPTKILLLDEASYALGRDNDLAFARKIEALRGNTTVLMITHREDQMRLADAILVLARGELTHAGAPDTVLNALKGKIQ